MVRLYQKLETWWFEWPQKLRFLLVGGFNTLLSYVLFLLLESIISYFGALILSYAVMINVSILTMRYYVFRASGNWRQQYTKAALTYLLIVPCNTAALRLMIEVWQWPAWLAQATFTLLATIAIWLLHSRVNFRD